MDEFKNNYKDDIYEERNEADYLPKAEIAHDYTWYDDEYNAAMRGTVSGENALSIYKPKIKKLKKHRPLLAAVVSSIVTTAICCSIFAAVLFNSDIAKENASPSASTLSVSQNNGEIVQTALSGTDAKALSIPDIYTKASGSVVSIICTSTNGFNSSTSSGSGVILTKDGYIATNNHVINGASIITVKTIAGQSLDAQLVGKDERTDLAVLKVSPEKDLPSAEIGNSANIRVGDLAVAIGNPLQEELVSTLTVGYISAIDRTMIIDERQMTMLQTDAAINPGNSGGALINIYGQVIGITTAKSTGYDIEGLGFAIPMNEAIPVLESIIKNGYVTGRPLIGITGIDITQSIAQANDLPVGVYVNSVNPGGSADKAGIKNGDVIIECEGQKIESVDDINAIRDTHKVGDTIKFVIVRNGKKQKVSVILQEEKPTTEQKQETPESKKQYIPSDFFSFFGW